MTGRGKTAVQARTGSRLWSCFQNRGDMPCLSMVRIAAAAVLALKTCEGQPSALCAEQRNVVEAKHPGAFRLTKQVRNARSSTQVRLALLADNESANVGRQRAQLPPGHRDALAPDKNDAAQHCASSWLSTKPKCA